MDNNANIRRFEELMNSVNRDGCDKLMNYIRNSTDFYTAPASTKFHLACEGGLLQHSLNVYDCFIAKKVSPVWGPVLKDIPDESFVIMALLHDLCKVNCYKRDFRNKKSYEHDDVNAADRRQVKHDDMGDFVWVTVPAYEFKDDMPLGHGEKSALLIQEFIKLKMYEVFAIRWHMGFTVEKSDYGAVGDAMEMYPVVLALHEADLEASKLMEDVDDNKM